MSGPHISSSTAAKAERREAIVAAAFRDAIANADQVGFVLGGGDGYGHGIYATGPARLIITDFKVQ